MHECNEWISNPVRPRLPDAFYGVSTEVINHNSHNLSRHLCRELVPASLPGTCPGISAGNLSRHLCREPVPATLPGIGHNRSNPASARLRTRATDPAMKKKHQLACVFPPRGGTGSDACHGDSHECTNAMSGLVTRFARVFPMRSPEFQRR